MAKPSLAQNLEMGILSVPNIAKLAMTCPETVYRWIRTGQLKCYQLPCRKKQQVLADDVVTFFREHDIPIPKILSESAAKFRLRSDSINSSPPAHTNERYD